MKMRKTLYIFMAGLAMMIMGCGSAGTTDNTEPRNDSIQWRYCAVQ